MITTSFRLDEEDRRRLDLLVAVLQESRELPEEYRWRLTRSSALRYLLERWERGLPLPKPNGRDP